MEQTLGKRIVENRKRMGLTQDQLAEQLGVTAQAISKWENDLSCPDITMLPKLAEIFGVTTDELLGHSTTQKVHEAEVVEEDESEGIHFQKGNWEFKWDSGRRDALTFALLVLLFGGLTLAAKILNWDVSWWSILWPSCLFVFGLRGLFQRFSFFSIGCAVFGAYFLVDNLGIWELNIGGELVFPIIIVLFGLSLLVDALRKPKKPTFQITHNGGNHEGKTKSSFNTDEDSFDCSLSFGQDTRVINLSRLAGGEANCSFGELTVDLRGCEAVAEDCEIDANCSFGQLTLCVPKQFRVDSDSSTAFGAIEIRGEHDPVPQGVIRLDANVSFGEIEIQYI